MQKKIYLLAYTLLLLGSSYISHAQVAAFTGGHLQHLSVCENSAAASIDTLMQVGDTSTGQTVAWTVVTDAAHGTLVAAFTTTSAADTLTPSGLSYMPAAGYSGNDTFVVGFADGAFTDTTTVIVTVTGIPNAGTLPSLDSICMGGHVALMPGGDPGGVWHSTNTVSVAVNDTGRVTGIAPGTSRVTYIVTNICGTDTAAEEIKVQGHVQPILGDNTVCPFQMLTLLDASAGGNWTSSSFFTAAVIGGIVVGITPGTATISYSIVNACGTTTATLNVTVLTADECNTGVHTQNSAADGLSIFPNPNNGTFILNMTSGTNEPVAVIITNIVGEVVSAFTTITNQSMDVRLDKPAGIYFVKATTSNGIYTAKVVVQK